MEYIFDIIWLLLNCIGLNYFITLNMLNQFFGIRSQAIKPYYRSCSFDCAGKIIIIVLLSLIGITKCHGSVYPKYIFILIFLWVEQTFSRHSLIKNRTKFWQH